MKVKLNEILEPEFKFSVEEASGDVDGKNILGKLRGEFFVPEGISRNRRFYPKSLWEKQLALPDVQKRLTERRMFGTVGHNQPLDDQALLEGKISHFVRYLGIEGSKGIGEALILDTPAGRILNTMARAGCKLFVSSRADGSYKGEHNGIPVVDPDTYTLSGFDVVCDPGFLQASPSLVEAFNQLEALNNQGDSEMGVDNQLLENLAKENATLRNDMTEAVKENESLKNEKTILVQETAKLKQQLEAVSKKAKIAEQYVALGTPVEIEKCLENAEKVMTEVKAHGGMTVIGKAINGAKAMIEKYRALGTADQITEALTRAKRMGEELKKLGSPADIRECLKRAEAKVAKYETLGSIKEIEKVFAKAQKVMEGQKAAAEDLRIKKFAAEMKVAESAIRKVWGKMSEKEMREFFPAITGKPESTTFVKKTPAAPITEGKKNEGRKSVMNEDSASRLMRSFS